MLGSFAVGKTSLVRRFVKGIFSDKYLTTMGAKVDKKTLELDGVHVDLLLWDLNGEDRFQELQMDYVQGAAGYLLVVDSTRQTSLDAAHTLHQKVQSEIGSVPFILVLNKTDLNQKWDSCEREMEQLEEQGWTIFRTSAKTGTGVDDVFTQLAQMLID